MLAKFYIPRLYNDFKPTVQKIIQMFYRRPSKKRRHSYNFLPKKSIKITW